MTSQERREIVQVLQDLEYLLKQQASATAITSFPHPNDFRECVEKPLRKLLADKMTTAAYKAALKEQKKL